MSFIETGFEGDFNAMTPVDIVPVPSAATRRLVRSINVSNTDSVEHNVIIYKSAGAGPTVRELTRVLLLAGESFEYDRLTILDNTNEKITGVLGEAIATVNPTFDAAFADAT
jgi:hypothetical protein